MEKFSEELITILTRDKKYPYISFLENIAVTKASTSVVADIAIIDPVTKNYLCFIDFKSISSASEKIRYSRKAISINKFVFNDVLSYIFFKKESSIFYIDLINDLKLEEKPLTEFPTFDEMIAKLSNIKIKEESEFQKSKEKVILENKQKFVNLRTKFSISFIIGIIIFFLLLFLTNKCQFDKSVTNDKIITDNKSLLMTDSTKNELLNELNSLKLIVNQSIKSDNALTSLNDRLIIIEQRIIFQERLNEVMFKKMEEKYNALLSSLIAIFVTVFGIMISIWIEGRK